MTPLPRLRNALLSAWLLLPAPALAAWPTDPAVNLPLCTAGDTQYEPRAISDGAGGTIVCWSDYRSGKGVLYVQRLDPQGTAQWTAGGSPITPGSSDAWEPRVIPDGAGGAIITWFDDRNGYQGDVYAQRIGPAGTPLWSVPGVPITSIASTKILMDVVADGAGGAVCGWYDDRSGGAHTQYVQRLTASGSILWSANGVPLTARNGGANGMFTPDGTGGVISAWTDSHTSNWDVYAQRIDAAGAPAWGVDGIVVCPQPQTKWMPSIVSDAAGGAIVSWGDLRPSPYIPRAYVQRLDATGARLWADGGVPFASGGASQFADTLLADGHGGVFGVWSDSHAIGHGLYAQHLDAAGVAQWGATGAVVDTSGDFPVWQVLALDGSGGLLLAWQTGFYPAYDLRAQSLSGDGTRRWSVAGAPLCTAAGAQSHVTLVGDGNGGFTAAWEDLRVDNYGDIYAQHLGFDGSPGSLDVPPATAPRTLALSAPWPTPARAGETIALRYTLPATAHVRITLADVSGRAVRTLDDATHAAGAMQATWDGRDAAGRRAAPGLYFVRLEALGHVASAKLVLTP